jgi:hypothetical protein
LRQQKSIRVDNGVLFVTKLNETVRAAFVRHPEPPSIAGCNGYEQVCVQRSGAASRRK